MNPVKQKMISFLTEAARNQIEALGSDSPYTKELNKIEGEDVIRKEIKLICEAATLAEMTKIIFFASRIKKASEHQKEVIKNNLKKIAEKLLSRVETKSGPLRLPKFIFRVLTA